MLTLADKLRRAKNRDSSVTFSMAEYPKGEKGSHQKCREKATFKTYDEFQSLSALFCSILFVKEISLIDQSHVPLSMAIF